MVSKKTRIMKNWMVGVGAVIVIGSHLVLMWQGSLSPDLVQGHSILNVMGGVLMLGGYLIRK